MSVPAVLLFIWPSAHRVRGSMPFYLLLCSDICVEPVVLDAGGVSIRGSLVRTFLCPMGVMCCSMNCKCLSTSVFGCGILVP